MLCGGEEGGNVRDNRLTLATFTSPGKQPEEGWFRRGEQNDKKNK